MYKKILSVFVIPFLIIASVYAKEPDSCKVVRFSDVGWTDITATTGMATIILQWLGYLPKNYLLAVPVTFASQKNNDIDVFLGLWMPSMTADIKPYSEDKSVVTVRANLLNAKYTLAVPKYVYEAGVKDFSDLKNFAAKFDSKIYGIEAGNDGNRLIQAIINDNAFELGKWKLVESSEQGMLGQVKRMSIKKQWIVFLGWEPHPMNTNFSISYLSGGDKYFGPNFGGATVYTTVRKGYLEECSNVGTFLKNLEFNLSIENELMGLILDEGLDPRNAAMKYLKKNPDVLNGWLKNVSTFDGENAINVVKQKL